MEEPVIVHQVQFASLEEFIEGNNNFFSMFFDNHRSKRNYPFYQRFKQQHPELCNFLESEVTITRYRRWSIPLIEKFPWEKLWEAYKLMSKLVYLGDLGVRDMNHKSYLLG